MTIKSFFSQASKKIYKKNEIILRPEEHPSDIFYIEEGYVRVYSLTEWGDEKLLAVYKKNELFPLMYIFDHIPLTRYYEALDTVIVRKIQTKNVQETLQNDPEMLAEFIKKMAELLHVYNDRIDNLEYTNAHSRLVSRLISLAKRFGEKRGHCIFIQAPLTHKDIASSIAMTRETSSREFEKLEKKNLVRYIHKKILILDITKLEKELSSRFDKRL